MAIIRPETRTGGYIFSVVSPLPLDTVVQLGMHMSPTINDKWNLTLYYTDSSIHSTSQILISYEMPYTRKWTTVALRVLSNKITIFSNCIEVETFTVKREPIELIFDSASTFYLAQAGLKLGGKFEVSEFFYFFFLFNFLRWTCRYFRKTISLCVWYNLGSYHECWSAEKVLCTHLFN